MTTIEELEQQEEEALNEYLLIGEEIDNYWLEKIKDKYGVEVGDIVLSKRGRALVTGVKVSYLKDKVKPQLIGRFEIKSGKFEKNQNQLFTRWELIE